MGPTCSGRVSVPRYATRFVGRRAEVAALHGLLQPGRLVTVVGLGGAGKTRLAAELVSDHDGVWVDLSAVTGPDEVASRVAEALDLPADGGADPSLGIVNALREQPTLLALDNCETELVACRDLVDALLAEVEPLTVLATSRVPLASGYEFLYPLPPLAEGNDLFADRAARVGYAPSTQEPRPSPSCAPGWWSAAGDRVAGRLVTRPVTDRAVAGPTGGAVVPHRHGGAPAP